MKTKIDNYTFNKTAKTITFTDYSAIRLDGILLITNVTDNIIIYNFADATKGGTVLTNVLTLAYDTSSMDNADKLLIYYDDSDVELATVESQDAIVEEISNKDIMIALKALIVAMANPSYVDKSTNQMRSVVTGAVTVSGTVTSSTTVAISDITLKGTYQPRVEILSNNLGAWSNVVRNKIT
jgi:hypothetical protein